MASISSRAKHFQQPQGGFLGIVSFEQYDGIGGLRISNEKDVYNIDFDNFLQKYLRKNPFPEPYNTYEKSLKLIKRALLTLVFLENEIEPAELFGEALKGAANIGDSSNAERLFQRVNNSDKNFRGFVDNTYKPENDIFDDRMMETVCDLLSYEYYANGRYSGVHITLTLSDELANYLFEMAHSIINSCIYYPTNNYPFRGGFPTYPAPELAYTRAVNSGDIDLVTKKAVWKIFISGDKKPKPSTPETLEVLMQYIMAVNADPDLKDKLQYIGIYDPNRNLIYVMKTSDIPQEVIDTVSADVIGYDKSRIE